MVGVASGPFGYSVLQRLTYQLEVAVAQVEQQLLEGAANLDPGVSPGHDAIDALFVGGMFYQIAWMSQGEFQLVALHGEDTTVAAGQGIDRSGKVGGIRSNAQVVDHVASGYDAEARAKEQGSMEDTLVVGLTCGAVVVAHGDEVVAIATAADELLQLGHGLWVV